MQVDDLDQKVAIVTGGSRGLGREIARSFAENGATVVIASRNLASCEEALAELRAAYGIDGLAVSCHVGRWDECEALFRSTVERFGRVHVLVNNAGVSPLYESIATVSEALFDKVLAVNLKGPFRLSTLAAEHMRQHGGGSIINVSSISAVRPLANQLPYGLAKAAVNTLTVGLAHAYGPEVRVNGIMPGAFLTDIAAAWDKEEFARRATEIPLRRAGNADEIAGAALYLASDASSYTSGAIVKIDGGWTWS